MTRAPVVKGQEELWRLKTSSVVGILVNVAVLLINQELLENAQNLGFSGQSKQINLQYQPLSDQERNREMLIALVPFKDMGPYMMTKPYFLAISYQN